MLPSPPSSSRRGRRRAAPRGGRAPGFSSCLPPSSRSTTPTTTAGASETTPPWPAAGAPPVAGAHCGARVRAGADSSGARRASLRAVVSLQTGGALRSKVAAGDRLSPLPYRWRCSGPSNTLRTVI